MRLIFEKAKREGLGPLRIANYLNEQGYMTRKGKRWNQSSVGRILTSQLYLGFLKKGDAISPHLPELQIVDDNTFMFVQEIRKNRGKGGATMTMPMQTRGEVAFKRFPLLCSLRCAGQRYHQQKTVLQERWFSLSTGPQNLSLQR